MYEELFHHYLPFARSVFHLTRKRHKLQFLSLEDALQELYLILWKRLLKLPPAELHGDLRHFLIKSLTGSVLDSFRREQKLHYAPELSAHSHLLPFDLHSHSPSWSPHSLYETRQILARPLPELEYTVLKLLLFEGHSYEEISLLTGLSLKQVYSTRLRATALLRSSDSGKIICK